MACAAFTAAEALMEIVVAELLELLGAEPLAVFAIAGLEAEGLEAEGLDAGGFDVSTAAEEDSWRGLRLLMLPIMVWPTVDGFVLAFI